jgi:hypothetical protein
VSGVAGSRNARRANAAVQVEAIVRRVLIAGSRVEVSGSERVVRPRLSWRMSMG